MTQISEDENALLDHVTQWGSDGYPVARLGRRWAWQDWRGVRGSPIRYKTKRDAVAAFEVWYARALERRLPGVNLSGSDLRCRDMTGEDLAGANLAAANLEGANLAGADLSRAKLDRAKLAGANLAGANLARAGMYFTDLDGANLSGANLSGVAFGFTSLIRTNLTGANLSNTNLACVGLNHAQLNGTQGVIDAGMANRYHVFGWLRDGRLSVRAGCRDFRADEGRAYWKGVEGREEILAALTCVEAMAHVRGWDV